MPAFADQLDERQRWDLATYIASFSTQAPTPGAEHSYNLADLARQTPQRGAGQRRSGRCHAVPCAASRATEGDPWAGAVARLHRRTLDKSLAAYQAGDHEQAYDLSVAAYLEGFDWLKARWITLMPPYARTPRKP